MELRKLQVRRLPGVEPGFTLDFSPGLNIIQGANGSGKSSVCRAILGLLFPDGEANPRSEVTAVFQRAGQEWFAAREGTGHTDWSGPNGARRPPLPQTRHQASYHLGLLDLHKAAADIDDRTLAREVLSRLAGGYDLDAIRESEEFKPPSRRSPLFAEIARARQEADAIRRELHGVAALEDEQPQLERRIQAGRAAELRREALALAERLARARSLAADAQRKLAALPAILAKLRGDEVDRRQRLDRTLQAEAAAIADAEAAAGQARRDLAAANLDRAPEPAQVAAARQRLQALQSAAQDLERLDGDLAAAAAAVTARGRQLDPAWATGRREPVPPAEVAAAVALVRRAAALAAQADAVARALAHPDLTDLDAGGDPGRLREAVTHLTAWLAVADVPALWPAVLAAAGLAATGAGWLAVRGGWVAGAALAAGLALLLVTLLRPRQGGRRHARKALATTGIPGPPSWHRDAVGQRLRELTAELAAAQDGVHRRARRDQLLADQTRLADEHETLAAQGRELAGRCGLDPIATEVEAAELLQRVSEHHTALARLEEIEGKQRAAAARLAANLAELGASFAPFGLAAPPDLAGATARLEDLASRADQHRNARARLEQQTIALESARQRREQAHAEWTALYRDLDLAPGEITRLEQLLALAPRYQDAVTERDASASGLREIESEVAALGEAGAGIQEMAAAPASDRAAAAQEAVAAITDAGNARERRGLIEGQTRQARQGTRLQDALARVDTVRARWSAEREQTIDRCLAQSLLEGVAREHETRDLPAVLERARALLGRFTAGRYELQVRRDGNDHTFQALDTASRRPHALTELSDGTRAQLLLAARLAFVEDAEPGEPLPLLLDEALLASDPSRFAAVAGAILDLVRNDRRQVLVFTASPATVAAWQLAVQKAGLPPAPVIDLGQIRRDANLALMPAPAAAAAPEVPDPAGLDPAAYAQALRVPPLDVRAPASAAHLFYLLLDDLPALRRILQAGPETWGACAALHAAVGDDDRWFPAGLATRLQARAAALDAFLAARRVGRNRRLDREGLLRCEAVKRSIKVAEIAALLQEVEGDPARLLAALDEKRVANVRAHLRDELEGYLVAEGFIDRRTPIGRDDLRARVAAASAELAGLFETWWLVSSAHSS